MTLKSELAAKEAQSHLVNGFRHFPDEPVMDEQDPQDEPPELVTMFRNSGDDPPESDIGGCTCLPDNLTHEEHPIFNEAGGGKAGEQACKDWRAKRAPCPVHGGQRAEEGKPKKTATKRKPRGRHKPVDDGDALSPFHSDGQTDLANARRLAKLHGENLRYCPAWKKFLHWDKKRWQIDDGMMAERLAKDIPDRLFTAALAFDDMDTIKFAGRSASSRGIMAMLELLKSEPGMVVRPEELDQDHMAFNCSNGTLSLTTGELRKPRRDDLITKLSPIEFDPDATCPVWDKFLERCMNFRQGLIDYLRRLCGYSLTGLTTEQILAIFYGVGANGKTTFLNAVLHVFGDDYGWTANRDLLIAKTGEVHPTELAALHGRRLVVTAESDDGKRFAEGTMKQITGQEKITARRMREDFWSFMATFKLILATNHKPQVRGTDHAVWRRMRLVPWDVVIPDAEQDKQLEEKLKAEAAGILAWCVRGCREWQRDGLGIPDEVMAATAAYRSEQDILAAFIADECVTFSQCKVKASAIYEAYREWCDRTGEHVQTQRCFGQSMTERRFERMTNNGTWYCGVALRSDAE